MYLEAPGVRQLITLRIHNPSSEIWKQRILFLSRVFQIFFFYS